MAGKREVGLTDEDQAEVERRQKLVDATLGEESEARIRAHRKGDEVTFDLLGVPQERLTEVQALVA